MPGPLDGVRVLEVASYVFVPAAGAILSDWGADVLKIEHPGRRRPVPQHGGLGGAGRRPRVRPHLRAQQPGQAGDGPRHRRAGGTRQVLDELIDGIDVFLTNLLPAARQKLRIEPDDIWARNPRVVYGRGTAQGPRGPAAGKGGFDGITYWGRSGAAIGATMPGQEFPTPMPGPGFGDLQSGMAMAGGIGTALFERERTGTGTVVDVSLMSTGLWAMGLTVSGASLLDVDELPHLGHFASPNPLTNTYRTKDGHFIALGFLQADRYWPEFCLTVDRLEWLSDERFTTADDRRAHAAECVAVLDQLFAERDLAEWEEVLSRQQGQWDVFLPAGRIRYDEQVQANEFAQEIQNDQGGTIVLVPAPAQFGGAVTQIRNAPKLGADTEDVLRELGRSDEEIAALRAAKVVG